MGFLMFAGLIGSIAYSSHVIKNDIRAETIDYQTRPTFNSSQNRKKIKTHFVRICKRAGIKLKNDCPINKDQCHKGIEYLQYQGYKNEDIEIFKDLYMRRYELSKKAKRNAIIDKNKQLLNYCRNHESNELVVLRKRIYKCDTSPDERMNKLLNNNLWRKIVDHHTYIRSDIGKFEEIWTLKVPKDFFKQINKNDLYDNICYLEDIYNGF